MNSPSEERHPETNPKHRRLLQTIVSGLFATLKDLGQWMLRSLAISGVFVTVAFILAPRPKPLGYDTTLFIGIDRPLSEASPLDAMPFLQFALNPPKLSASMVEDLIRGAADDPNIFRIVLSLDGMTGTGAGPATRLGDALDAARAKGKTVVAYASNFDNASWLLASRADEILMHPMGRFDAGSLKSGALYFGDALKRYGVEIVAGQAGDYKSAIEPYTRGDMSAPAKAALARVMTQQREAIISTMARRTRMEPAAITDQLNSWKSAPELSFDAEWALRLGLVDKTVSAPEFMDTAFGSPGTMPPRNYVALSRYATLKRRDQCAADWRRENVENNKNSGSIGSLTIEGPIAPGATTAEQAGAASFVMQIESFARSTTNKALLVRIDSPGGDAQSSEQIRSALARYRGRGRPVAVSMGTVAASGGYWIATAGDILFAEPTTITGSIGVFSLRASAAGLLNQHGVAWDGLSIGGRTGPSGFAEPVIETEASRMRAEVERIYEQFVSLVSDARHLDPDTYKEWAEGRILQAQDARAIGLIDKIGGIEVALEWLSEQSGVPRTCMTAARPTSSPGSMLSSFSPVNALETAIYALRWKGEAERIAHMPPALRMAETFALSGRAMAICTTCNLSEAPF